MKVEKLFAGKFVEVRKIIAPETGVFGYEYTHEILCDSKKVALLPYRRYENRIQFLLRQEIVPSWDVNQSQLVSLTGSVDKGKEPIAIAVKELKEESGYKISQSDLIDLGICYSHKASDVSYFLFSVDLTGKASGVAIGDGSYIESIGQCVWKQKINSVDAVLSMLYLRLLRYLKREIRRK